MLIWGPSGQFRLTRTILKEDKVSVILGTLGCGGKEKACRAPSLPGLSNKEKA